MDLQQESVVATVMGMAVHRMACDATVWQCGITKLLWLKGGDDVDPIIISRTYQNHAVSYSQFD